MKGDEIYRHQLIYQFMVHIIAAFLPVTVFSAPWYQPADVNSGDSYQIAFVTSTTITATSPDLRIYIDHVNAAADLDPEGIFGELTFRPIISTPKSDARDIAYVFGPVYNTAGQRLATDYAQFWDGQLENPIRTITGHIAAPFVWTGTRNNGTKFASYVVGTEREPQVVSMGDPRSGATNWMYITSYWATSKQKMYALSDPIDAVPLPPGIWLFVSGLAGLLVTRARNRKPRSYQAEDWR